MIILLKNYKAKTIEEETIKPQKMEAESRFDRGVEAVNNKNDLESIRSFRQDYEQELEQENILKKSLTLKTSLKIHLNILISLKQCCLKV